MKKYLPYIAAGMVALASILPACGGGSSSDTRKKAQAVAGLKNIRLGIEELLNGATPQNPIEIIISDAILNDPTIRFTEGQATLDIGYRLQDDIQNKYNTTAIMVTGRFVSSVVFAPYEKNRIFVGTPSSNRIIGDAISALPDAQDRTLPPAGTGRVYGITAANGNFLIAVTANDSLDVMHAGYVLSEYGRNLNGNFVDFNARIADIDSTTLAVTKVK